MLPALMSVMYRMTEMLLRRGADDRRRDGEDEGVGCHTNHLPRLLTATINILTKSPAVSQVLSACSLSHARL